MYYKPGWKIGQLVKVVKKVQGWRDKSAEFYTDWISDMDKCIGNVYKIVAIEQEGYKLNTSEIGCDYNYYFHPDSLSLYLPNSQLLFGFM